MKKLISCIFLLSIMLLYISCNDDTYNHFTLKTPPDTMELTASRDTIVLNEDLDGEVALTFEWKEGAYRGEGTEITYYFKMDIANNDFKTSIPKIEMEPGQRSISFKHKELNDLITATWKMQPGDDVDLEAEIIADVTTYPQFIKPEISKILVNVTSYIMKPRDLFLQGTVVDRPVKFSNMTINKEYTWMGSLKPGTFKFTEKFDEQLPSYNKGKDENTLVYRTKESEPDELFTISKEGTYAIYVDIETKKITCTPVSHPEVYMIGDATPAKWELNNIIQLQWDYVQGAYVYEGEFYAGEMKLPTEKNWSSDTFMPVVANADPLKDNRIELVKEANPDKKWKIAENGQYRMILDINIKTITLTKL